MERKKPLYKMTIDETDGESGTFAISLVADPAIEEKWVALSKTLKPIQLASVGDKHELIGTVLIPDKLIPRIDETTGEEYDITFPKEVIAKSAELFMMRQKNNNITLEHDAPVSDVSVIESWIVENAECDKSKLYGLNAPDGSWVVKMKVNNNDIWDNWVKTGEVSGFSLEGLFGHQLVTMSSDTEMLAQQKLEELRELLRKCLSTIEMETSTSISTSYPGSFGDNKKKD